MARRLAPCSNRCTQPRGGAPRVWKGREARLQAECSPRGACLMRARRRPESCGCWQPQQGSGAIRPLSVHPYPSHPRLLIVPAGCNHRTRRWPRPSTRQLGGGGAVVDVHGVSPGATGEAVRFWASLAECRASKVPLPTYRGTCKTPHRSGFLLNSAGNNRAAALAGVKIWFADQTNRAEK